MSGAATVGRLVVTVSGDVDQLKIDMREAQAITGAATKEIVNGLQGITDATYTRNAAGQRMVTALQQEIDTFGMSADEINIYKASLAGVGDQYSAMIARLNDMKSSQAAFTNRLAESEASATLRIREMVAASAAEGDAMRSAAAATQGAAAATERLTGVSRNWADAQRLAAQNMAGVTASMQAAQAGTVALSTETQRILDRFDPLGTKLRSLQAEFGTLRKEMGNSVDPAAMKAFQGLEDEISKTQSLMAKAGVDGFGKMEEGAKKGAFATAGATRELIVLGHEAMMGNFSRMPGSFMVLAERMHFTSELFTPLNIGMIALAAAAIGVGVAIAQGHEQMVAMNNAMLVTSNYAGMTRLSMDQLAASMTQTHEVTIGAANAIVLALVNSGRIGSESIGQISRFISDFAKSTGQSIDEIAPKMIALFEDPIKGAQELNRTMHFLTTTQIEHIAALERTGQAQKAQDELATAAANHMPKQAQNIGVVTQAVLDQRDAWSKLWQAMQRPNDSKLAADQQAQGIRDQISEYLASGLTRQDPHVKTAQAALDALEPAIIKQKELTQAQKEAAAANELQAKSWDAVKASSTAYHIQELRDRLTLIKEHKSEAGPDFEAQEAAKRDAIRKTNKEIEDAGRSISADDRAWSQQQITSQEALREVKIKADADNISASLKLGQITKEQFDAQMSANAMEENVSKQHFERQMARVAGINELERQGHRNKLAQLQAEFQLLEQKGENSALVDEKKSYDDIIKAILTAGSAEELRLTDAIKKQKEHNAEIGKTRAQIELAKQAAEDLDTAQLQSDADFIRSAIAKEGYDGEALTAYTMRLTFLDSEIAKRKELSDLLASGAFREANTKAADDAAKAWKHTANTIEADLTNAILDGGGRGFQKLIHDMEYAFARMILQPILAPISGGIASIANPLAAQAQAGGVGGYVSIAQSAKAAYDAITNGFSTMSTSVADGVQAGMNATGLSSNILTNGPAAQMAGTAAGYAGGIAAGKVIGSAISGQFGIGGHGSAIVNIGTAAGAIVGGPVGAAIGGTIGGLLNRAFGMGDEQVTGRSLTGTLSSGSFSGTSNENWHQDGGWFRSDKNGVHQQAVDSTASKALSDAYEQIKAASADFATTLGIDATSIAGRSQALNITVTTDAAANQKAVSDFFVGVGDTIAKELLPNLSRFATQGEAASATLQRIAGDYAFIDTAFQSIGTTFGAVGVSSIAARERLVTLSGGLDALGKGAAFFQQNFLSEAERLAPVAEKTNKALADLGYAGLNTRDDFKNAVLGLTNSGALATEAGAKTYAGLMAVEEAFAQLHPVIAGATDSLRTAADIASERSKLQDQFDQLTMSSTQLLTKQRNALDAANRPLFDMVQAAQKLADTSSNMAKFRDAAQSLHDGLLTGSLSTLTPEQQYAELRRQYEQTKSAALGGDVTAQGNVAAALNSFLTASQKINGGDSQYAQDFAMGQQDSAGMAQWASGQVDSAQAQLAAMNMTNSILTNIAKGITNLPAAIASTPAVVMPAPVLNYVASGAVSMEAVATEVKALRTALSAFHADANKNTGNGIVANDQSNQANADAIVTGVTAAVNRVVSRNYKLADLLE